MKKVCATCGESKSANPSKSSQCSWRKERGTYESNCKTCRNAAARAKTVKKDRQAQKEYLDAVGRDPHGFFAADIIELAILDWRRYSDLDVRHRDTTEYKTTRALIRKQGYGTIRDELLAFFASEWFGELCDTAGVDAEYVRKHIGV